MKNLFDRERANELKDRVGSLQPDSRRLWGKMGPAQAMAHCALSLEWAVGDTVPPRMPLAQLLGRIIKPLALGNDSPMKRNSPTAKTLIVPDDRDLATEKARLRGLIDRFVAAGPAGCTTHPHSFFGRMTPQEWAILMYKHVDHHLRQFGA